MQLKKQNNKNRRKFYLKLDKDIITTYKKYEKYYQFQTEAKDKNFYITYQHLLIRIPQVSTLKPKRE